MQNYTQRKIAVGLSLAVLVGGALIASAPPGSARSRGVSADVEGTNGASLGSVRMIRSDDGKVIVRAALTGLTPGFHGFHVHTAGVCDPAAVDTGGAPVPFFTAGGHFNPVTTNTHGAHAGDMPPLLVATDGTALLKFKTDRFKIADLMDADGAAVILHAGPDNLAHIPATATSGADRYHSHTETDPAYTFGADLATKATGDAGARYGCGVITRVQ
jgi:superoxide dismutase, Cu-Zn family